MLGYRVVKTGPCEVELHSINHSEPVIKPFWNVPKHEICRLYCVLVLEDGRCVVEYDQWCKGCIMFMGFFFTNEHGEIKEFTQKGDEVFFPTEKSMDINVLYYQRIPRHSKE